MGSWAHRVSIPGKLLILVGVLIAALLGTGGWAFGMLRQVMVNGPLYKDIVRDKDLIADILPPPEYIIESLLVANLAIDETDPKAIDGWIENLAQREKEYNDRHAFWLTDLPQSEMRRIMLEDSYAPAMEFYRIMNAEFIPALKKGDKALAFDIKLKKLVPAYMTHRQAIDKVVAMANEHYAGIEKGTAALVTRQMYLQAAMIVGVPLLVVLFVALPVMRSIVRPLREMTTAAQAIARGELDQAPTHAARDEMGQLADSFRSAIAYLDRMAVSAESITALDLTNLPVPCSEKDRLGNAFVRMGGSLGEVIDAVRQSVNQIQSGVSQMAEASASVAQGAAHQAASQEEVGASIAQIGDKTRNNAENATQASHISMGVRESADKGNSEVGQMTAAMKAMQVAGSEIAKVVRLIDDIAFQTNLLALNAAVEAARAGRHGKGFAVVAEEVRSLAGRSAKAARETAELIERTLQQVQTATALASRTESALLEIVTHSVKAADLVGEIASASNEQAQAVVQIGDSLRQIENVTQQNSSAAEETASVAEELSGQALELRNMMNRFRLAYGGAVVDSVAPQPAHAPWQGAGVRALSAAERIPLPDPAWGASA